MIPYFDAHCDTIHRCAVTAPADQPEAVRAYWDAVQSLRQNSGHVDLVRGKVFARYAQFFALYHNPDFAPEDGMWAMCRRLHDCFLYEMETNADLVRHCCTGDEVRAAVAEGKIAALLSVEGADLLECDPERISTVAQWGVRLCNPVWNHPNALSGTNCAESDRGLSQQGRDFVRQLEEYHIYADMSHLSDPGFWDIIRMARQPVVASHSNSRALCPHPRNLTDDMFHTPEKFDKNGGWLMLLSVAAHPLHRGRGFASKVMRRVIADCREQGRKGIVLTCKERLIPFYQRFGFENEGKSASEHGGAVWYQMRLTF